MHPTTRTVLVTSGVGLLVAGVAVAVLASRRARIEKPAYDVLAVHDGFEVRRYAPMVQACVVVAGDLDAASREGFRTLAHYIFGNNHTREDIAMTAPVEARPALGGRAPDRAGTRIPMTAPVAATRGEDGWTIAFTMPAAMAMSELPRPNDGRIRLVRVPGQTMAAVRFAGRVDDARVEEKTRALVEALEEQGFRTHGPRVVARYDAPSTPAPLRRNEILIPVG